MIIPPTIRNTSNEMPKMLKTLIPISADATRMMRMLSATLIAADRLCAGTRFGVSVKKIEPHTTGLMTAERSPLPVRSVGGSHRDSLERHLAFHETHKVMPTP